MAGTVHIDHVGRPRIYLGHGDDGPVHCVVLESVQPIVEGFCETCFGDHGETGIAGRKARSCAVMVQYLSLVNRDRPARTRLIAEINELLRHQAVTRERL